MAISRSLKLLLKLSGADTFRKQLRSLQVEATKLQTTLSSMSFGGAGSFTGNSGRGFANQFAAPIEQAVASVQAARVNLTREFKDLGNFANNINTTKNLKSLSNVTPKFTGQALANSFTSYVPFDTLKKQAIDFKNLRIKHAREVAAEETKRVIEVQKKAKALFQTGFGLHIAQMYIAPIIYGLEQLTAKMISTFTEFDKLFTDYMVKSQEYGEYLTKADFYAASVGQTYGINDAAKAAERFAASGVDVAKNQQALTSVMQVATVAHMDYSEAANGVIRTMQAMHMSVQDVTVITDALINSANASTAELSDLVQWFEYAASSAYQAGLDVQQLSAYLGILASTGTPNTGAAMRQLFLQLSKQDIQESLMGAFSWITPDDLTNVDQLILKMRNYVRSQEDQKAATLSITRLLGGKANAQQALNNLLMSEPELWNQVTSAVTQTGSTQDLYNKVTNNASDAIERIKVNFDIWMAQLGQVVGPGLKAIADMMTFITKIFIELPGPIKTIIGLSIIAVTALAVLAFGALGVAGALSIMSGTILMTNVNQIRTILTTMAWKTELKLLATQIFGTSTANTVFSKSLKSVNLDMITAIRSAKSYTSAQNMVAGGMIASMGAMIGYSVSSAALQKSMYAEAHVVSLLTSAWIAFGIARMGAFTLPAIAAGVAVGGAYEAFMYDKIESAKRDARLTAMDNQIHGGQVNKNYYITMDNANINADGLGIDDLLESSAVGDYD